MDLDHEVPEVPFQVEFTADADTASGMAWAFVAHRLFGGRRLIGLILIVVGFIVVGISSGYPVQVLLGLIVLLASATLSLFRSAISLFRRMYPPDSAHTAIFEDRMMTVTGVMGTADTRYGAFNSIGIRGRAVTLGLTGTSTVMLLPEQLFPPPAIALMHSRIGR